MKPDKKNVAFAALRVEGGIISSEFFQTIAALEASMQNPHDYGLSK